MNKEFLAQSSWLAPVSYKWLRSLSVKFDSRAYVTLHVLLSLRSVRCMSLCCLLLAMSECSRPSFRQLGVEPF